VLPAVGECRRVAGTASPRPATRDRSPRAPEAQAMLARTPAPPVLQGAWSPRSFLGSPAPCCLGALPFCLFLPAPGLTNSFKINDILQAGASEQLLHIVLSRLWGGTDQEAMIPKGIKPGGACQNKKLVFTCPSFLFFKSFLVVVVFWSYLDLTQALCLLGRSSTP
jgi:hypothetical protein